MTKFVRDNENFYVSSQSPENLLDRLPAGNYTIGKNPMTGQLFLQRVDSFKQPGKLYGNVMARAQRIMNTFDDRPGTTGVLLNGEKGSGKTQLARVISLEAEKIGMPTIIINGPWTGDAFNALLQSIDQPCVVFLDEFEKVYDNDDQEAVLTLLDGTFTSKKLFLFTVNNRPGRIFYMLDFYGLSTDFIVEYCNDTLNNKDHITAITRVAMLFEQFNFDMLKALVEELNRYGEDPYTALEMLNAKPTNRDGGTYDIKLKHEGKDIESFYPDHWDSSPLTHRQPTFSLTHYISNPDPDVDDEEKHAEFKLTDLKKIDADAGTYEFVNERGDVAVFTRRKVKEFSYRDLDYAF